MSKLSDFKKKRKISQKASQRDPSYHKNKPKNNEKEDKNDGQSSSS